LEQLSAFHTLTDEHRNLRFVVIIDRRRLGLAFFGFAGLFSSPLLLSLRRRRLWELIVWVKSVKGPIW